MSPTTEPLLAHRPGRMDQGMFASSAPAAVTFDVVERDGETSSATSASAWLALRAARRAGARIDSTILRPEATPTRSPRCASRPSPRLRGRGRAAPAPGPLRRDRRHVADGPCTVPPSDGGLTRDLLAAETSDAMDRVRGRSTCLPVAPAGPALRRCRGARQRRRGGRPRRRWLLKVIVEAACCRPVRSSGPHPWRPTAEPTSSRRPPVSTRRRHRRPGALLRSSVPRRRGEGLGGIATLGKPWQCSSRADRSAPPRPLDPGRTGA